MGIFIFFFLLVLFHGYIKSSSSLGFAKSKNGQIEYASTFLEAKHSRSKLVSHYSISRIRRKIKGLSEANAAATRASLAAAFQLRIKCGTSPIGARSLILQRQTFLFLHCPFSIDSLRLHVRMCHHVLWCEACQLRHTDHSARADEQIARPAENRLQNMRNKICVGGKWVAWGRFKPMSGSKTGSERGRMVCPAFGEKQSLEQQLRK